MRRATLAAGLTLAAVAASFVAPAVASAASTGVRGRVLTTAGSAPVVGAAVAVSQAGQFTRHAFTGSDGRWTVVGLPTGTWQVCTTPPTGANLLGTCTDTVKVTSGTVTAANQQLATGASVYGTVTDPIGNPLQRVTIDFGAGSVSTAEDGTYRIAGLRPGPAGLCFRPSTDFAGGSSQAGYLTVCRTPTLKAGGKQLDIALPYAGALTGRVTDNAGRPVADASVTAIMPLPDDGVFVASALTDEHGVYLVRNLPNGTYRMDVRHDAPGYAAAAGYIGNEDAGAGVVTEPGETAGPNVVLERYAGISGKVTTTAGTPLVGVPVQVFQGTTPVNGTVATDADGLWRQLLPSGGHYRVCAGPVAPTPQRPRGLAQTCVGFDAARGAVPFLRIPLAPPAATSSTATLSASGE